jgi:hypothetical protein
VSDLIPRAFGWLSLALVGIGFLTFDPPGLLVAVLLALPWAAVAINVGVSRAGGRSSLFAPLFLPGLAVALRGAEAYPPVAWGWPIAEGIAAGAVLVLAVVLSDRSLLARVGRLVLSLPFAAIYGFGLVVEGNARLDTGAPSVERADIISKIIIDGATPVLPGTLLRLGPWRGQWEARDFGVPQSLWDAVSPGETVCVEVHPGALRIAWLAVAKCRETARRERPAPYRGATLSVPIAVRASVSGSYMSSTVTAGYLKRPGVTARTM